MSNGIIEATSKLEEALSKYKEIGVLVNEKLEELKIYRDQISESSKTLDGYGIDATKRVMAETESAIRKLEGYGIDVTPYLLGEVPEAAGKPTGETQKATGVLTLDDIIGAVNTIHAKGKAATNSDILEALGLRPKAGMKKGVDALLSGYDGFDKEKITYFNRKPGVAYHPQGQRLKIEKRLRYEGAKDETPGKGGERKKSNRQKVRDILGALDGSGNADEILAEFRKIDPDMTKRRLTVILSTYNGKENGWEKEEGAGKPYYLKDKVEYVRIPKPFETDTGGEGAVIEPGRIEGTTIQGDGAPAGPDTERMISEGLNVTPEAKGSEKVRYDDSTITFTGKKGEVTFIREPFDKRPETLIKRGGEKEFTFSEEDFIAAVIEGDLSTLTLAERREGLDNYYVAQGKSYEAKIGRGTTLRVMKKE